ncbi:unnamed protein product [Musa acuminata subsp. malaccensis]|uniref:(wild Malaysian banana) hypothetical protein n=1 Tax=Musa acuminata subsp. malaccensis TaxID=214687 RepID=A0A804HZY4_MUSAM|nr:unnamed protein product [Musa acuminata subsp. malaccensis]
MEKNNVMVCAAVGFLGLLSAALGFAAEATRITVSDVQTTNLVVCTYPRTPALALGLLAAVALMIAQAIIKTVSGCICCTKYPNPSDTNWTLGLISFIATWFFLFKLISALFQASNLIIIFFSSIMQGYFHNSLCTIAIIESGVFSGGAVLSLASVAFGIVYYVSSYSAKNTESWNAQQNQGIALGHPHTPPQTQPTPVFVHEDTYNRQQFP